MIFSPSSSRSHYLANVTRFITYIETPGYSLSSYISDPSAITENLFVFIISYRGDIPDKTGLVK